jgi:hypothetical protein
VALAQATLWETIAGGAAGESQLWAAALRPARDREAVPVFAPLGDDRYALGLETIYEGYLLHYGRPRLFSTPDRDTTVLLGDYLYAHGLVRIAELGDVAVVGDLAELLSLCAQLRADAAPGERVPDGPLWAATVALLGADDARLAAARANLRDAERSDSLVRLATAARGEALVAHALALHEERVTRIPRR